MENHEIQYIDQNTYNRIMSNMAVRIFGKYVESLKGISQVNIDDAAMERFNTWISRAVMATDDEVIAWIEHHGQADASLFKELFNENIGDFSINGVMSKYRVKE